MEETAVDQKQIIRRGYEALNRRDRELFRELHTEDVLLHETEGDIRGIDAVMEHLWTFVEAFPNLDIEIEEIISEGDQVAARHTSTGTHEGELMGIEPTGSPVEVSALMMFRFEDGKVAEIWFHDDRVSMLRQIGALDAPTG